ncbi:hypothetical protein AMS68_007730 [Peltaster fructicola]|uniref:Heterokaryon incompatibility domain-containing protein n=1 Tax=Peltaster fructicola TaxID=286661 RepID=A0A6H0Y5D7_9PEZI|nr:hypothetical protein AMS68_007730 [Peltaster fructicola]
MEHPLLVFPINQIIDENKTYRDQFRFDCFYECVSVARHSQYFRAIHINHSEGQVTLINDLIELMSQAQSDGDSQLTNDQYRDMKDFTKRFLSDARPNYRAIIDYASCPAGTRDAVHPAVSLLQHQCETMRGRSLVDLALPETPQNISLAERIVHESFTASWWQDRRLATFSDGRLGWVNSLCRVGDQVALLQGGPVPFILRRKYLSNQAVAGSSAKVFARTFSSQGDAYVQGIMRGEAWKEEDAKWVVLD